MSRRPEIGDTIELGPTLTGTANAHPACLKTPDGAEHHHGVVRTVKQGEPIHGDALLAEPTGEPGKFKVVDRFDGATAPSATKAAGSGPAQVASEDYRDGWDRIFGAKRAEGLPS